MRSGKDRHVSLIRELTWERTDSLEGREEFQLVRSEPGDDIILSGTVAIHEDAASTLLTYTIECEADWRTRTLVITITRQPEIPGQPARISAEADGKGAWTINGYRRSDLHGCLDVDLGFTPATNTLPIRRLNLPVGESALVTAAWVRFPELTIQPLRQRYTRLAPDRYRYESLDSGFTAELITDELGLVIDYPGGWRRLAR